ncbi:MAG: glycosyltransferase [Chloroflexi bacterium]|nr:glycosyltransferase [Chloroflexota bacterium]
MRIQIASSRVGGGHQSVAEALRQALLTVTDGEAEVWVDDLYVQYGRFPLSWFPWAYATITRRSPSLWRAIFDVTNRPPSGPRLNWIGDVLGGPAFKEVISERRPDAVVTVLPGTTGFVARSVMRSGVPANIEVVITDWADVHLGWASTFPVQYTVPTDNAAQTLASVGIRPEWVDVNGFLVREPFSQLDIGSQAKQQARARLDLPRDRFLILMMVGAEGSPAAYAHLDALARTPLDAEILVVCGRNQRLFRRVQRMSGANRIRPLGFVEHIADLMVASDLLVTKTGGVTLAEGFSAGLPIIGFDPLPGQEEGNARYIVEAGAAELASSPSHLATIATELRWRQDRLAALVENGQRLSTPDAALATAEAIVERIRCRGVAALPAS